MLTDQKWKDGLVIDGRTTLDGLIFYRNVGPKTTAGRRPVTESRVMSKKQHQMTRESAMISCGLWSPHTTTSEGLTRTPFDPRFNWLWSPRFVIRDSHSSVTSSRTYFHLVRGESKRISHVQRRPRRACDRPVAASLLAPLADHLTPSASNVAMLDATNRASSRAGSQTDRQRDGHGWQDVNPPYPPCTRPSLMNFEIWSCDVGEVTKDHNSGSYRWDIWSTMGTLYCIKIV